MQQFEGVKVFSATKARDRELLGEQITDWLRVNDVDILDKVVTQSSDTEFHCITITLFYKFKQAQGEKAPEGRRLAFAKG